MKSALDPQFFYSKRRSDLSCGPRPFWMLLSGCSLQSKQQNSNVFVKKIDGITSVFAIFLFDGLNLAIP